MRKWLALFLALVAAGCLLLSGCVSQKDYNALKADYDAAAAELASVTGERDALNAKLTDAAAKAADFETQVAALNATVSELTDAKTDLETRLSAVQSDTLDKAVELLTPLLPATVTLSEVYPNANTKVLLIVSSTSNEEWKAFDLDPLSNQLFSMQDVEWNDYDWIWFENLFAPTKERWYSFAIRCSDYAAQDISWGDLS